MGHERAEDDRRHRAARDAEGEHGDERAADDRVVRALGSGHALDAALAVAGGVLVPALGLVVGDDRGDLAARAGEHPDPRPHDRGAHEDGLAVPDEVAEDLAERALMRVVFRNEGLVRADEVEHLREGEKADHAGDHGDALQEVVGAEGETGHARIGVEPDGGHEDARRAGEDALAHVVRGHHRDGGQPEKAEPKTLGPAEAQGETGERGGKAEQEERAHDAAEGRGQKRGVEPDVRPPLLAQGPAVEGGGHRGGGAGRADEDGGVGPAVDGPGVDRAEHDQAASGIHGEGGRDHEGDAHRGRKAGQRADDDAPGQPGEHQDDVQRFEKMQEGGQKKFGHAKRPSRDRGPRPPSRRGAGQGLFLQ